LVLVLTGLVLFSLIIRKVLIINLLKLHLQNYKIFRSMQSHFSKFFQKNQCIFIPKTPLFCGFIFYNPLIININFKIFYGFDDKRCFFIGILL